MARDSQKLIIIFVGEVKCKDRGTVARLRISLALGFTGGVQQLTQKMPEMLPDEGHEVGVVLSCFILIKLLVLTHHGVF